MGGMNVSNAYVSEQMALAGSQNFTSKEAEASVLYSLMAIGKNVQGYVSNLSEKDFYFEEYGKIFRAVQAAAVNGNVDIVTVDASIQSLFPTEYATLSRTMLDCVNTDYNPWNIDSYIQIVKGLSVRRQTIMSIDEIMKELTDPTKELSEILDKLRTEGRDIDTGKHKFETMTDVVLNTFDYLDKRSKGQVKSITTGISNVDSLIGGFFGGELTVIGARPSVGKSAFGANIALEAAKKGYHVAICSREMTDVQFGQRMISNEALVDGMKLRKGDINEDEWEQITDSLSRLSKLPIEFLFSVRNVEDLRKVCQPKVERGELDILIVDYLQLMHTAARFKEEHLRVGYISKALKDMATDFNIPIIALAQVNRDTDGQMPSLKSLKASGDIEQDADGVIFLHRPASANDPYVDPRDKQFFEQYGDELTYLCIGVAKQRQGAVGKACVIFDSQHMRYYTIEREMRP